MAEVAPKESIMSLITDTFKQRKVVRDSKLAVEFVVEESLICLKCSRESMGRNYEDTAQNQRDFCVEHDYNTDKQAERTSSLEGQNVEKEEEKPNLKRRNTSVEESLAIVQGEGLLKKMKISDEPQASNEMDTG